MVSINMFSTDNGQRTNLKKLGWHILVVLIIDCKIILLKTLLINL